MRKHGAAAQRSDVSRFVRVQGLLTFFVVGIGLGWENARCHEESLDI